MCPPDRESACDVGIRIRGRRAGTGANPIRPVPISAGPHVNRLERKRGRIGPNVRNRRAENTDRNHQSIVRPIAGTEPDGEEPGRGNIRPSTRIRQWQARTIRDSNYERMHDDRKPACGIRRQGTQGVLDPGETTHGPTGLRKTQTSVRHTPIGHRTGNHQTVSSSQTPYGKREGDKKNKHNIKQRRRTWPKPHRP